ncbi:MAG TPA: 30S ribosomal protein S21 [Bacteroidales bacterium]|jgi:small subunit ribosomal protein S21|nr:30S ribosomal protein S21 [Bacteroidales bacterium]MDI9576406.1 30S ribosomal protein S21 [Bacteroidota bacterium]MDD3755454.1 30S ribosomal protein S21 [Bacteroidales bacterium]MDY0400583.1 30S ribosomal protein S21 [Bacteroidales bacterium]HOB77029.1 30S ribosomal protein S21 [Bacteroidales bacterium]
MLIVELKEGDSIDKALKKLKRKYEKTGVAREVKARQFYVKPSEREREKKSRALYMQRRITKSMNA